MSRRRVDGIFAPEPPLSCPHLFPEYRFPPGIFGATSPRRRIPLGFSRPVHHSKPITEGSAAVSFTARFDGLAAGNLQRYPCVFRRQRAHAAKSTGPTTPAGIRNSSRNGTRHGILASAVLIDKESRERFAALLNSLNADFQPENNTERLLVEKVAVSHWRLLRLWVVEAASIKQETRRQADSPVDTS